MPANKIHFITDGTVAEYQRPEMERKVVKGFWYKYISSPQEKSVKVGTESYFTADQLVSMQSKKIIEIIET
jgi:hypothetical protein